LQSIFSLGRKKQCLAEMLGTYLLVVIGPGSVVAVARSGFPQTESLLVVALVFGAVVAGVIVLLGPMSGAIINPALTLASAAAGLLRKNLILPYIAFQIAGALAAGFTLAVAFGGIHSAPYLGSTRLAPGISPVQGTAIEIAGTFVLAFAALTASTFLKNRFAQAFLVGSTLFVLIVVIGPLTGASFNPARSLGPSVFAGYFGNQLIYYVGPLTGGLLAGLTFNGAKGIAR
jgi:glycerol uptake facilitator-like aquaporin